ncbi:MAG TPA: DUF1993 domain-containing protein [Myxococcota bacterium]|jgi:hypothetical protein
MPLSMHQASAPIFLQMLNAMLAWLDKAEAHAKAKKFDPNNFVSSRLTPDMLPFSAQIGIATDHVKGCLGRLAGVEAPKWADDEKTLDDLRARIRKAIDYAKSIQPGQLEGSESREITLPTPRGPLKFSGEAYLKGFALPNFFFHVTMAYALLRHGGVEIGKMDYLGAAPR